MDNRRTTKRPDGRQAKTRAETAEKNNGRPQRGGGVSLNLYLPGVSRWSGVCNIDWYIAIYRDIMPRIMRHHKIWYIEISYPYPEFSGPIWRFRTSITSKYLSTPNAIFDQLGAPSLVYQESKIDGYLAVNVQKQWYLLESVPSKNYNYIFDGKIGRA